MNWMQVLAGSITGAVMAMGLGWAFKWKDRQMIVVSMVLSFFVTAVIRISEKIG